MKKVVSIVLFVSFLHLGFCVDSRFDEYLWTKSTWNEYKLYKPRDRWRIDDAPNIVKQTQELRQQGCAFITTDGPFNFQRKERIENDEEISEWLVALVDRVVAGATIFGNVCVSVVEGGWDDVQSDVYNRDMPTAKDLHELLEVACVEAVEDVLKKYKLVRQGDLKSPGEWLLLIREKIEESTDFEIEAVELACERFMMRNDKVLVEALLQAALDFKNVLRKVERSQVEGAKGSKAEHVIKNGLCEDIHPKCETWADEGECIVNPNYMHIYCRVSCGLCEGESTFQKVGRYYLNAESRSYLFSRSQNLLQELKGNLCPSSMIVLAPIMEIKYESSFQAGEIQDISQALIEEFKGKCFLVNRGWWKYELCFFARIRQLHFDGDNENVLEEHLIGTFHEQMTQHLRPLILSKEEMDRWGLYGPRRPYILQTYVDGDRCENDIERTAEVRFMCSDGLKQKPLAPKTIGIGIEEAKDCRYIINMFLPFMCSYENYRFLWESPEARIEL